MPITAGGITANYGSGLYQLWCEQENDDAPGAATSVGTANTYLGAFNNPNYTVNVPQITNGFNFHLRFYMKIFNGGGTQVGTYYLKWFSAKDITVSIPAHSGTMYPMTYNQGSYSGGVNGGTGTSHDNGLVGDNGQTTDTYGNSGGSVSAYRAGEDMVNNTAQPETYMIQKYDGSSNLIESKTFTVPPNSSIHMDYADPNPFALTMSLDQSTQLADGTKQDNWLSQGVTLGSASYYGTPVTAAAETAGEPQPVAETAPAAATNTAVGTASTGASQNDINNLSNNTTNELKRDATQALGIGNQAHDDSIGLGQSVKGAQNNNGQGSAAPGAPTDPGFNDVVSKVVQIGTDLTGMVSDLGLLAYSNSTTSLNQTITFIGHTYVLNIDQYLPQIDNIRDFLMLIMSIYFVRELITAVRKSFA